MLTRNKHIRGVFRSMTRLMAALFAMQVLVGGFCLLTAEAHAMPQSDQSMVMDGNCAKSMHTNHDEQTSDHSDACYHCDQPTELSNASYASVVSVTLVLSDVISLPAAPLFSTAAGLFSTRTPTGPPRSSSLLYTTSQRILI